MTEPGKTSENEIRPREPLRRRRVFATTPFVEFKREEVEQSIADRFEQQVQKYPQHTAIKTAALSVSYSELNQMANGVAHALLARSDTAGERIVLLLDQGAPFVAAMLGVFKAGKVCVPLDPSFPEARAAYILDDSQAGLLITDNKSLGAAQPLIEGDRQLLNFDELNAAASAQNPSLALWPQAMAYLIYTSGSTGQPKGVIQIHRNLLRNVMAQTNGYHLCANDRICLLASCGTAQGMATLFGGLLNGATVCPFSIRDAGVESLGPWLIAEKITVYISAATVFRHFIQALTGDEQFPDLRLVRLGSEAVRRQDVEMYKKHFAPGCLFINALSSTETGNFSQYVIDQKSEVITDLVPVGYAVEGMEIMLLDQAGSEVGLNCVGEIAIKGRYLSPGYWRRPDLTEKVFLPAPDGSEDRIYRTGDLGIKREDGCLEHAGRKDFRVKIRGLGVELEEVEARLFQHPGVQNAVAEVRPDGLGDNRLIIYLVARKGQKPTAHELRSHLKNKLPEQMVPAAFVFLDRLPMTPNGKVDRTALATLEIEGAREGNYFVGPRDQVEADLATIWQEILQLDQIGVHDSFYDLGGHSLTATRVVSRVRSVFQVDLPLREFLEHPTIAWLAEWLESTRRAGPQPAEVPLQKVPRARELPLSFAQQRLWFLNQFDPDSVVYNLPWARRLTGALNLSALEQTLTEIVRRHESLRTVFSANGRPAQRILPPQPLNLDVVDLRNVPDEAREGETRKRIEDEGRRPFDLQRGPLFRPVLLRLAESDHVLILTMHHIVSDHWSKWILAHELERLYEAFCAGRPSPLPELPIQYADFAQWQHERLRGAVLEDQLGYWKKKLGDNLSPLKLPTDRPRPAVLTSRGATISSVIPLPLTNSLKIVARREGATLYMILLAAFQTLLHRYTGQPDIAVGSPIANRNRIEIESLIGFFVNTVVLRNDLSGDPTFCEFLRRLRGTALEAYAHQDLPFEKLVEVLQPKRELSYTPLFQVMFALQNVPRQALRLSGLSVRPVAADTGTAKFDLALTVLEEQDGLQASWEYNTDLFDSSMIIRLSGHFQNLLEGIVANPAAHLSDLPLLTAGEIKQLRVEWNETRRNITPAALVHQLFETQVQRTPDAIGVVCEQERLTYQELNGRANQLANHLRGLGVGPEVLVGICLERSLELVVGLLGILKAGGAYLPLDSSFPKDRLKVMLEDAQVSVLLTTQRSQTNLPSHKARTVFLDSDWPAICQERDQNLDLRIHEEELAYVIYTSGSTGKPKGVQVPHRALANCLTSMQRRPGLTAKDRLLAVTPLSFDIAALELFLPLCVGARLILASRATAADGTQLAAALENYRVTVMQATPATWRLLIESGWQGKGDLKILCGGEALSGSLAGKLLEVGASVWNLYGPTETTIWSLGEGVDAVNDGVVPIGGPIGNTQIYLLDPHQQPVPIGVPGELYIGGAGLARGYLAGPDLTAEKFVPNPFSTEAGSRLYRTGDLARYLSNGAIQFLGRIDEQVKIRGYRIEMGELEVVMSQHAAVADAVAVVREDTPENKQLVVYVVGKVLATPTISELRNFLKEKLPEYMIPGAFVIMEALPLSANGKVDRRALPAPVAVRPETFAGPRTPIEKKLAEIFMEVLKAESVGIHDNFFDLGGHSLLATRVVSRVRTVFRVEVAIRHLFQSPTVIELAAVIEELMLDQIAGLSEEEIQR